MPYSTEREVWIAVVRVFKFNCETCNMRPFSAFDVTKSTANLSRVSGNCLVQLQPRGFIVRMLL